MVLAVFEFWEMFKQVEIHYLDLILKNKKIVQLDNDVHLYFQNVLSKYCKYQPHPNIVYGVYCLNVRNQKYHGRQLLKRGFTISFNDKIDCISSETLFNKDVLAVVISGENVFSIITEILTTNTLVQSKFH